MKKFLLIAVLLAILAGLSFQSCQTEDSVDVDQDRIYTEFELFYNANEDKTYARAVFRFGNILGTLLELSVPSQVTFQGDVLDFKPLLGFYEKDYAGFIQQGSFVFTNTDGDSIVNDISIRMIDYPALDTVARNAAFELTWVGDSLGVNENVTLVVNGENEGDLQTFVQDDAMATSIICPLNKMEKLGMGPGWMAMDRRYVPDLVQATDAGGKITGRYRPVNINVYLK